MKDCDGKLAEGEATGHAHRVKVQVLERADLVRVFQAAVPVEVEHDEHQAVVLPPSTWCSDQVVEHDHLGNIQRRVQD